MNNTNLKTYLKFTVKPMATAMAAAGILSYAIHCRWQAKGLERFGGVK